MYRFDIFCVAYWGLLHLLLKISWVYIIKSRLCEHSSIVRFEKRAAKTPQHGLRYGNILMLYVIINTYEWFFCYNWHELCSSNKLLDFSIIFCFLVKYAIWISNMNELLPHPLLEIGHCFRWWPCIRAGGSHYLNQWWPGFLTHVWITQPCGVNSSLPNSNITCAVTSLLVRMVACYLIGVRPLCEPLMTSHQSHLKKPILIKCDWD